MRQMVEVTLTSAGYDVKQAQNGVEALSIANTPVWSNGNLYWIDILGPALHRSNPASGGHETTSAVEAFLDLRPIGPEHEALRALLKVRE